MLLHNVHKNPGTATPDNHCLNSLVAANLQQVLAWLGLGDFDKDRLVLVLVWQLWKCSRLHD
jgi:hypothetical protein